MKAIALVPAWIWLILCVATPGLIVAVIAFAHTSDGVPPFALAFAFDSFDAILGDPYYLWGFVASLRVAAISAAVCLLVGYPMALAIARSPAARRPILLLLIMLPFWTGFLLRIAAWIGLLRDDGWIDRGLMALGVIASPLPLLHTNGAMIVGIVYAYLPFMILPLEARLSRIDLDLEQAASDLGATPAEVFGRVTWPLSLPGVAAGLVLVFVPVTGEYVIPELLGAPDSQTLGRVIWEEFFQNSDWPRASALTVLLLAALLVPAAALRWWRT